MYCTSLPWLYVYHVISMVSFWRDLKWRCSSGCLVIDYFTNARVGMFGPADGLWHGTIGRYGLAERNPAG